MILSETKQKNHHSVCSCWFFISSIFDKNDRKTMAKPWPFSSSKTSAHCWNATCSCAASATSKARRRERSFAARACQAPRNWGPLLQNLGLWGNGGIVSTWKLGKFQGETKFMEKKMMFQELSKIEEGSSIQVHWFQGAGNPNPIKTQNPNLWSRIFSKGPALEPPSFLLFLAFVLPNLTEVFGQLMGMVISKHQQTCNIESNEIHWVWTTWSSMLVGWYIPFYSHNLPNIHPAWLYIYIYTHALPLPPILSPSGHFRYLMSGHIQYVRPMLYLRCRHLK